MFSLAIGPDEIETIVKKCFTDFSLRVVHLKDGNYLDFILKINSSCISDFELKTELSCDQPSGKILFRVLHVKTYSDRNDGFFNRIKKWAKEITFDPTLSLSLTKAFVLYMVSLFSGKVICKESDDTISFSLQHLAEIKIIKLRQKKDETASQKAKRNAEKNIRYWSFLARIRPQAFFVRDNRLVLQAGLDDN